MSGLLRRIRRPGAAEEPSTEAVAVSEPAHGPAPSAADGERPAGPAPAAGSPLPAGASPEDVERRRATGRRGKLRRRARFLRRARELALRDLGGLVYEARRRQQDGGALVDEKVQRLAALDAELHGLEAALGAPRGETVLREPGVGGTCARCGELHASDARYCSRCGLDLTAAAAPETTAEPIAPADGERTAAPAAQGDAERTPTDHAARADGERTSSSDTPHPAPTEAPTSEAPAARAATPADGSAPEPAQAGNGRTRARREPAAAETPDRPA